MKNCPFCNLDPVPVSHEPGAGDEKRSTNLLSRTWRGIQWLVPTTLLVLMPKCPLCVAAYVALLTGIGISAATARVIQILMLMFCVMSLTYLVGRLLLRFGRIRQMRL
jgi:hypothetical protein